MLFRSVPQEQKEEPKVITPKAKKKTTRKATATKKEESEQVEKVEAVPKEETSEENKSDLATVIEEINNEEPDENQTALFNHWGEPNE